MSWATTDGASVVTDGVMRAGAAVGEEDDGLTMGTICKEDADEGKAGNGRGGRAKPRERAERRKMLLA